MDRVGEHEEESNRVFQYNLFKRPTVVPPEHFVFQVVKEREDLCLDEGLSISRRRGMKQNQAEQRCFMQYDSLASGKGLAPWC